MTIARCILGPLSTLDGGTVETLNISESIVQAIPANDRRATRSTFPTARPT